MISAEDRRRLLELRIRVGAAATPSLGPVAAADVRPTSHGQRRLWFLEQLQQTEAPYTLHAVQSLGFGLDPKLLEASLAEIVARHEVLRTTFEMRDDELVQVIAPRGAVPLRTFDLTDVPEDRRGAEALRRMGATVSQRFDLARGPLMRVELYRLAEQEWRLLVVVHHIVFDGPSFTIFFAELTSIYGARLEGRPHDLPALRTQYGDFAQEQGARLTPERIESEVAFWRQELSGTPLLDLPMDRGRTAAPTFRGSLCEIEIRPDLAGRLQRRAAGLQATFFTVLLGGFWAALAQLCGQTDFALGLPVTGRDTLERQDAIGFYVDTVVVRPRLEGDPTSDDVVRAARAALARSLAHRALPFEMVVQHLSPERDLGLNPFFQVGFQLMEYFTPGEAGGSDLAHSSAMFDLGVDLWPHGDGLGGRLEYNSDLFDPASAELVVHAFLSALEWIAEPQNRLGDLDLGRGLETSQLSILDGPAMDIGEASCLDLIAEVAARHGPEIALEDAEGRLTYADLMDRVAELGAALTGAGVEKGGVVVLELERSRDLVCLQLAAMWLGAAFVCLDPAWPQARRDGIVADIGTTVRINAKGLAALRAPRRPGGAPTPRPERTDAAYMIFTSGSTGRPKGVVIEHGGLLNVAHAQRQLFGLGPGRRVAQLSSPTFDASVFETVLALCSGATLVVAPPGIHAGEDLERLLAETAADTVVLPPSVLATVRPDHASSLALVCAAGESCPTDLARGFGGCEFWNLYGPTETTIWTTAGQARLGPKVSIGPPILNTSTLVMDSRGRPAPLGMVGELWVAGPGLARGYLNQPELTGERFVSGVAPLAERAYRTGDLVRQTRAGELVFLGRADRQVKVRGLRIELEEVEAALRAVPGVAEVVVDTVIIAQEPTLVAYLQCADGSAPDPVVEASRAQLRARLPAYMCPSRFVAVATFARSASGKIDRSALPALEEAAPEGRPFVAPRSETERKVSELMALVLRAPRLSVDDDFFHVGGHSLAAVRLAARARTALGVDLSIADIFAHSTVAALAARVDALAAEGGGGEPEEVELVRLPRGTSILDAAGGLP